METTVMAQGQVDVPVGPVAWAVFADNGNIRIWSSASDPVRKLAEEHGMKLVPLYAIPEGWTLAPKEPTPAMVAEGCRSMHCPVSGTDEPYYTYKAMLSAAPLTPNA